MRERDECEQWRTVVVVWTAKRVGESAWRSECLHRKVKLGAVERFELSSGPWFGGGRIEPGSMVTVIGGFANRSILGNELMGAGQGFTLPAFLEPGTSLTVEVMPL